MSRRRWTGTADRRHGGRARAALLLLIAAAVAAAAAGMAVGAKDDDRTGATGSERSAAAGVRPSAVPRRAAPPRLESMQVGSGARGAQVVRPAGGRRLPVVVFLHGWGLVAQPAYRPWIRHIARHGNQVVVPTYQRDETSDPTRALADALAGIRAALRAAPPPSGKVVVAGHSAGAALAADYAAGAARESLPRAAAVLAVYPGRRILGYPGGIPEIDPAQIPASTEIVAMAGAADTVVGQAPAQQLVAQAVRVPAGRKRYVLVSRPAVADHDGPTRATRAARRIFWDRLDELIRAAR